jgi:basic amino acid/polyamine antiporter, APA family
MTTSVQKPLHRSLGITDLFVLSSSSMAPAYSLAAVMGLVVAVAGLGAPLALVVSTIPITFVAIGFMRLTSLMPSAGAVFTWTRNAFGRRASWFIAMLVIIAYFFAVIASALPTGVYTLKLLVPALGDASLPVAVAGVAWIAFSTYFLVIGARPTALLSAVFLIIELAAILLIAGIAFAHPYVGTPAPHGAWLTIGSFGWSGIMAGALLSLWITAGWEISAYSSEESSKGGASAGSAAVIGLLATFAVVLVCEIAFLRLGTVAGFTQHQDDALAYISATLGGGWIQILMTATVLVSSAAAIWTTMLILSRGLFAMGRDGLLPQWLGAVHPRHGSPWAAILTVAIPSAVVMLLAGLRASAQSTLLNAVGGASLFLGATFIVAAFSCAKIYSARRRERPAHTFTGLVLPLLGGIGTLALVIRYTATQDRFFQTLAVVGLAVALVFAMAAGRWSRITPGAPIAREEAPLPAEGPSRG